jgi:hypothetical protein
MDRIFSRRPEEKLQSYRDSSLLGEEGARLSSVQSKRSCRYINARDRDLEALHALTQKQSLFYRLDRHAHFLRHYMPARDPLMGRAWAFLFPPGFHTLGFRAECIQGCMIVMQIA